LRGPRRASVYRLAVAPLRALSPATPNSEAVPPPTASARGGQMAMVPPDPEATALFLLAVAEVLERDTPDPTDSYDVDTRRTRAAADTMTDLGENIRVAVERTGPEPAEGLVRALVRACREMLMVCATLEEYARDRRPEPAELGTLLEHARSVHWLLDEHVRAIVVPNLLN